MDAKHNFFTLPSELLIFSAILITILRSIIQTQNQPHLIGNTMMYGRWVVDPLDVREYTYLTAMFEAGWTGVLPKMHLGGIDILKKCPGLSNGGFYKIRDFVTWPISSLRACTNT